MLPVKCKQQMHNKVDGEAQQAYQYMLPSWQHVSSNIQHRWRCSYALEVLPDITSNTMNVRMDKAFGLSCSLSLSGNNLFGCVCCHCCCCVSPPHIHLLLGITTLNCSLETT
jgi:hypothetical protein